MADRIIRRALISVSDKTGLVAFAKFLERRGVEILSTGGSARALAAAGIEVREVAQYTGFPEILDGRVKTLHPKVHGGILARRDRAEDKQTMARQGIEPIDLVAVNLYPFAETAAKGASAADCIEEIDVGGPALIRAAAKNWPYVAILTDPNDYAPVQAEMETKDGRIGEDLRRRLAAKAFGRTVAYDAAIAEWFSAQLGVEFPERFSLSGELVEILRYGENPHQKAAFYRAGLPSGLALARQVQGKELSYNNLNDADAALALIREFAGRPAAAIVKHANPCGVAVAASPLQAWRKALAGDPTSAFGGILALNRPLDRALAEALIDIFLEVVIAPEVGHEARQVLSGKKNLRLLLTGEGKKPERHTFKSIAGGFLLQSPDDRLIEGELRTVSRRAPGAAELKDLMFAFAVAKHVKSNAVVFAKEEATVGIGAGQMSRVDAARIAYRKAQDAARAAGLKQPLSQGAVAASDAFFPFADAVETIAEAGATAIIQPGGSIRDQEVIAAADQAGLAMVFTGLRHFRH
jgi:phosphoribosylaminoimidazolecarboxamide formyltransferase/IMP cyclohydrolase